MMSVLSVPLMISGQSPTMMTVDMAFRINAFGDYGVANALGFISYLMTGAVAWIYLRQRARAGRTMSAGVGLGAARRDPRPAGLRVFGPLANLLLWAFAEHWYFPHKLPLDIRLPFWEQVFRPRGNAPWSSLGISIAIALLTVATCLALAIPAG